MNADTDSWPRPHRLTVDEYYRMAAVGLLSPDAHVELIEGEIVGMPPIGSRHAAVVRILAKRLVLAVGDRAEVSVQAPLRLDAASEPQPDLTAHRKATAIVTGKPWSPVVRPSPNWGSRSTSRIS